MGRDKAGLWPWALTLPGPRLATEPPAGAMEAKASWVRVAQVGPYAETRRRRHPPRIGFGGGRETGPAGIELPGR